MQSPESIDSSSRSAVAKKWNTKPVASKWININDVAEGWAITMIFAPVYLQSLVILMFSSANNKQDNLTDFSRQQK